MKFNSMWEVPNDNKPLVVPELPKFIYDSVTYRPGAKDENGKLLNDTRFDKLVKGSKTDLQEYIQSFADECDIYKILERCARSGDYSTLLAERDDYGDTTLFKADRADNDLTLKRLQEANSKAPKEVAEALLANLSDSDILAIIENLKGSKETTVTIDPIESEVNE